VPPSPLATADDDRMKRREFIGLLGVRRQPGRCRRALSSLQQARRGNVTGISFLTEGLEAKRLGYCESFFRKLA